MRSLVPSSLPSLTAFLGDGEGMVTGGHLWTFPPEMKPRFRKADQGWAKGLQKHTKAQRCSNLRPHAVVLEIFDDFCSSVSLYIGS